MFPSHTALSGVTMDKKWTVCVILKDQLAGFLTFLAAFSRLLVICCFDEKFSCLWGPTFYEDQRRTYFMPHQKEKASHFKNIAILTPTNAAGYTCDKCTGENIWWNLSFFPLESSTILQVLSRWNWNWMNELRTLLNSRTAASIVTSYNDAKAVRLKAGQHGGQLLSVRLTAVRLCRVQGATLKHTLLWDWHGGTATLKGHAFCGLSTGRLAASFIWWLSIFAGGILTFTAEEMLKMS